jgi:hypothetical protein
LSVDKEIEMKVLMAAMVVSVLAAGQTSWQKGNGGRNSRVTSASDPFNGTWKINRAQSSQRTGEPPDVEDVSIRVENSIQHYTNDTINAGGTTPVRTVYDIKYNDGEWHPQLNRATGQKTNVELMLVKVDERTQYRISRDKDGRPTGVMMRRMADGGRSFTSVLMNTNGEIALVRVFDKQ